MDTEQQVARHYGRPSIEQTILAALAAAGHDVDHLEPADLAAADEFHLGWRAATVEFAKGLGLAPDVTVLDIGSGIGGPARFFADQYGVRVTGLDLTPEFVEVADALTRRCGLQDLVSFRQGSAVAMPFADATYDVATLIHVGMNIPDKARLFQEAHRVLKPGGRFGIYDIMRVGSEDLPYPMPWAATSETSFVEPVAEYRRLLEVAGFTIEAEQDRRAMALALGREMRENAAKHGAPPLGLHTLIGPASRERMGNVMSALERNLIAPVEILARVR